MIVHLIDGTYELFRHFYGLRRFTKGEDRPLGAVIGVLNTVLQMIETGATHVGVATDHIIESFRNRIWPGYKKGTASSPLCSRNSTHSKKHSVLWVSLYGR
jgi:5'-3' exonuclease